MGEAKVTVFDSDGILLDQWGERGKEAHQFRSPTAISIVEVLFGQANLFANFLSGLMCLALFEGAYVTEIVRAGIQSVPRGQWEAGTSIGLTRFQLLRYVVMPQAIQKIVPPLCNQFIQTIKASNTYGYRIYRIITV